LRRIGQISLVGIVEGQQRRFFNRQLRAAADRIAAGRAALPKIVMGRFQQRRVKW